MANDKRSKERGDPAAGGRFRSKYAREIVFVLLLKLLLIVAIKVTFFSHPVSKADVVERIDAVFASQPEAPAHGAAADSSRKKND